MNSTLLLIKANILNSWGINRVLKSKATSEKVKAALLGVVIIYAFFSIELAMFMFYYPLSQTLEKLNVLELLISSSILMTTLFALIMSVYKIPGYLYSFKDYDMLMALPLKPSAVLASKMIFIYISNFGVAVVAGIPPLVIYGIKTSGSLTYYLFVAITTLFIPLIPISISALLAYILGRITTKFRSTNIILLIGSFALLIAVMVGSSLIGRVNTDQVQSSIPTVYALNDVLFWTKIYIRALKETSYVDLISFILISVAIFGIFLTILSKGFKSINSKMSEKYRAASFKMTRLKVSSPMKALFIKELRFYFSSYIYVLNTAFGVVMMTIFSVGTAVFGKDKVAKVLELPMAQAYIVPVIALVFIFCISFTFTTAASISLEGKSLWIIKSLPLTTKSILWSKIILNMTITVPALVINTAIVAVAFKLDAATVLSLFCVCLLYCIMQPILGILINLYFPKLEWTTQVAVVKQSASVLVATLAGFVTIILPLLLFIFVKPNNINMFLLAISAALVVVDILLAKVLDTVGVKKFGEL